MSFGNILVATASKPFTETPPSPNLSVIVNILQNSKLAAFKYLYQNVRHEDLGYRHIVDHYLSAFEAAEKQQFFERTALITMIDLLDYQFSLVRKVIDFMFDTEKVKLEGVIYGLFYKNTNSLSSACRQYYQHHICESLPNPKDKFKLFNFDSELENIYLTDTVCLEAALSFLEVSDNYDSPQEFFTKTNYGKQLFNTCHNLWVNKKFVDRTGKEYDLQYVAAGYFVGVPFKFIDQQQVKSDLNDAEKEKLFQAISEHVKSYATVKMLNKKIYIKLNEPFIAVSCSSDSVKEGLRAFLHPDIIAALLKTKYRIEGFCIPLSNISDNRTLPTSMHALCEIDFKENNYVKSIHPHASSSDGNICFGSMNKSGDNNRQFTIGDLIEMLKNINFSSVYRNLDFSKPITINGHKIKSIDSSSSAIKLMGDLGKWEERAVVGIDAFFKL